MNDRKVKKRRALLVTLLCSLTALLLAGGILLLAANEHHLFLFAQRTGLFQSQIRVEEREIAAPLTKSLEDWLKDDRVSLDQSMMLVNTEYTLKEDFVPAISEYKTSGVLMNDCMKEAYARLSEAVTEEKQVKLYVSSHFRTPEKQEELYLEDPLTATLPGASEHQTGLCVDVYVAYYAGDGFLKSPAGRFVNSHCHEYGFIIRYPVYGEDSTGIRFEPWHIRYVGQPHATVIQKNRLTLEEYILSMKEGQWYEAQGYFFCRQRGENGLTLPEDFSSALISDDNTGCYILTVTP